MSFSGDANSKYELTNFRAPNAGQKKLKRAAAIGGAVLVVWVGTIGVVAAKRFQTPDETSTAAAAPTSPAPSPVAAPQSAPPAAVQPAVTVAKTEESAPEQAKADSASVAKKSARSAARRPRSSKRYAATAASASSKPSSGTATRMKDDQLDALLKQFK